MSWSRREVGKIQQILEAWWRLLKHWRNRVLQWEVPASLVTLLIILQSYHDHFRKTKHMEGYKRKSSALQADIRGYNHRTRAYWLKGCAPGSRCWGWAATLSLLLWHLSWEVFGWVGGYTCVHTWRGAGALSHGASGLTEFAFVSSSAVMWPEIVQCGWILRMCHRSLKPDGM